MKYLTLFVAIIAILFSCKKKEETVTTEPEPTPVCVVGKTKVLLGKYRLSSGNNDTIEIVFLDTYCPHEDWNKYAINGLGKVFNDLKTQPNFTFNASPTIRSNEGAKTAIGVNETFSLDQYITGAIHIHCEKINPFDIGFEKLP